MPNPPMGRSSSERVVSASALTVGSKGPSENLQRVQQFVNRWRKAMPEVPIEYFDERFTSVLAHQAMLDGGLKKKARQDKALVTLRFRSFDSERQIECEPTVESEGSCSECKQWWRVTADEDGAVVSFDAPRQSPYQHTFMPHVQYAKVSK